MTVAVAPEITAEEEKRRSLDIFFNKISLTKKNLLKRFVGYQKTPERFVTEEEARENIHKDFEMLSADINLDYLFSQRNKNRNKEIFWDSASYHENKDIIEARGGKLFYKDACKHAVRIKPDIFKYVSEKLKD